MPDRWTAEDVGWLAETMANGAGCKCRPDDLCAAHVIEAEIALAALADAGRLQPRRSEETTDA